jgi:hypothetical protein
MAWWKLDPRSQQLRHHPGRCNGCRHDQKKRIKSPNLSIHSDVLPSGTQTWQWEFHGIPLWMAGFMGKSSMICVVLNNCYVWLPEGISHLYVWLLLVSAFHSGLILIHATTPSSKSSSNRSSRYPYPQDYGIQDAKIFQEPCLVHFFNHLFDLPCNGSVVLGLLTSAVLVPSWCLMQPIKMIRMSKFVTLRPRNLHALQLAYDLS